MLRFHATFALLLLTAALGTALPARADVDVHLLGAATSSTLEVAGVQSKADKWGTGFGALFFGSLTNSLSMKLGGLTTERKTVSTALPSRKSLLLPLLFGYRLAPGIRLELGGYYDYGLETPLTGFKRSAYGALGGLVMDIPLMPGIGLLLGGHYSMQLTTLSADKTVDAKYSGMLVTAGFRLGSGR